MASEQKKQAFKPVRLTKWNAVAFWCFNVQTDVCAICRNGIHEPCIECQADRHSAMAKSCTLAWGACNLTLVFFCFSRLAQKFPGDFFLESLEVFNNV